MLKLLIFVAFGIWY